MWNTFIILLLICMLYEIQYSTWLNGEIRRRTKVVDIAERISKLKCPLPLQLTNPIGSLHIPKIGRPIGQKDTGVETTYGKAQHEMATWQMDRRPRQGVVECRRHRTGHAGNQLGRPMFSIGQQQADMMMTMTLYRPLYFVISGIVSTINCHCYIRPLFHVLKSAWN